MKIKFLIILIYFFNLKTSNLKNLFLFSKNIKNFSKINFVKNHPKKIALVSFSIPSFFYIKNNLEKEFEDFMKDYF